MSKPQLISLAQLEGKLLKNPVITDVFFAAGNGITIETTFKAVYVQFEYTEVMFS